MKHFFTVRLWDMVLLSASVALAQTATAKIVNSGQAFLATLGDEVN
jgi:hypothetical protein